MVEPVFIIVTIHLTFLAYALAGGSGLRTAGRLVGFAVLSTAAMAVIALPVLMLGGLRWYVPIVFNGSLLSIPVAIMLINYDRVVPRISAVGVVLINLVAITFSSNSDWISWILNPLGLDGIFATLSSLWPSYLALLLIAIRPPGDPRIRFVLGVWSQAVGLFWLLPIALDTVTNFDATGWAKYVTSVFACIAAVHVAMLGYSLVAMLKGRSIRTSAGMVSATRMVADRVYVEKGSVFLTCVIALVWWLALHAWYGLALRGVSKVGVAYLVATVLGAVLMPKLDARRAVLDENRPAAARVEWRSYRATGVFLIIGFGLVWFGDVMKQTSTFIFGANAFSYVVLVASLLAGVFILNGLLAGAWIVGEAAGRPAGRTARRYAWIIGLACLTGWLGLNLPRAHPPGGLDGHEERFLHGRVYLWYAEEIDPWLRSGRAVYFEQAGYLRRKICGDASNPVDAFRVVPDTGIECRSGNDLRLVDTHGVPTNGRRISSIAVQTTAIAAGTASCRPVKSDTPTISCLQNSLPLGSQRSIPGTPVPEWLDVDAARYFRYEHLKTMLVDCMEVPARGQLPDGSANGATLIVFIRHAFKARPIWLLDREGSCARVYAAADRYEGSLFYEWHSSIAPYHGETKSPVL